MTDEQLPLFTDEQYEKLEKIDQPEGIHIVGWSKAEDKRIWNMFVGLMEWALCAPVTLQRGAGWVDESGIVDRHRGDVVLERLIRVMKWSRELSHESEQAQSKTDLQEAYRRLIERKKDEMNRLTNWEVCFVMMECSMVAPLSRPMYVEYMRAFAHCFGLETYIKITDKFEPLRVSDLESARYDHKIATRFPRLDDDERAWIENFNRRGAALRWPGTNKKVVVTEMERV
jgi:hypothetical protein